MAKTQVFPIVYKPGILRDGSPFQGDYCTNGQWIRFFRGQPQNIGGMRSYLIHQEGIPQVLTPNSIPTNILVYYDSTGAKHFLLGISPTIDTGLSSVIDATYTTSGSQTSTYSATYINPINTFTQFIKILSNINNVQMQLILCLGMKNYTDINSNEAICDILVKSDSGGFFHAAFPDFVLKEATGGMLYAGNRLFYYGKNGLVRWSSIAEEKSGRKTNLPEPFLFFEDRYSINISTDKVIYGAEWRGGANSPTILFWTISSVILLSNSSAATNQTTSTDVDDLSFSKKVLSRDSSILSSNCVVEYDGIFYWPGTQRFFVFNGVVLPLENNLNRQTFFDTIDMNKRQKVFGVKNVSRDEIWWFYPEKGKAADVGCTRAVIYNVVDNTWYDTAINRDAGFFDNVGGDMYTVGKNLVPYGGDNDNYIWQHEVGVDQVNLYKTPSEQVLAIPSYFTTPIISYMTFNKFTQPVGSPCTIQVTNILPNIVATNQVTMTIKVNSYDYPTSDATSTSEISLTTNSAGIKKIEPSIRLEFQGTNVNFTFKSEGIGSGYQFGTSFVVAQIRDWRV